MATADISATTIRLTLSHDALQISAANFSGFY
jgi:hypothetical protein